LSEQSSKKKVALKYCGGCDCTYDRLEYANKLKKSAEGLVEWVTLDDEGFDSILMIHGCPVACPERQLDPVYARVLVSVKDDRTDIRHIVARLMEKVFIPHLVCGP
jgi:hypothetical protein